MVKIVTQAGKILFARDKGSAYGSTTHACASLINRRVIASSIGNKVRTNTRNDLSGKLIRQQRVISIREGIDPINPGNMSAIDLYG
jgi:hypothetical protein